MGTGSRMGDNLILLCGMPRSGTTWIGKILDSHPETLYRHEPDSVVPGLPLPLLPAIDDADRYREALSTFLTSLEAQRAAKVSGSLPIFRKQYYSWLDYHVFKAGVLLAKGAGRLVGDLPILTVRPKRSYRLVWKSIESVGRIGVLARLMPAARLVLLLRHPCAYVASVVRGEAQHKFASATPTSDDYGMFELLMATPQARSRSLDLTKLKTMKPEERLAWRWALFNDKALGELDGLPNAMVLRYEDMCLEPIEMSKKLLSFARLPWARQTEMFLQDSTSTAANPSSYYSIYRDPRAAMNRWRSTLSAEQIDSIYSVVKQTRAGSFYEQPDPEGVEAANIHLVGR